MTKSYRPIPAEEMLADVSAERRERIENRARELIAEQGDVGQPTAVTWADVKRLVDEGLASSPGCIADIDAIKAEARRRMNNKKPS